MGAKLYRQISANIPIPCVDLVITNEIEFLLIKRKNKPAQGKWCVPGGRVMENETLLQAAKRIARQETGLNIKEIKFLTSKEFLAPKNEFGSSAHTISSIFVAQISSRNRALEIDK